LTPVAPDILARIVSRKREELRQSSLPTAELEIRANLCKAQRRDFAAALKGKRPAIISEIKKASPSRGILIDDFHPAELASEYERGGAAAISVLTDRDFFQGSMEDLHAVREVSGLPVLRKDFTISDYHVLEAAANGADAVLLIAAILDDAQLRDYREQAASFGMAALVEVHDASELERALRSGAGIVGVNNRDLRSFTVSLNTSLELAPHIPGEVIKVSESGIFNRSDIDRLMQAGYGAFLIGEHLVKSGDAARALQELAG
jgi:indole-3-glycerol phosphate synthase